MSGHLFLESIYIIISASRRTNLQPIGGRRKFDHLPCFSTLSDMFLGFPGDADGNAEVFSGQELHGYHLDAMAIFLRSPPCTAGIGFRSTINTLHLRCLCVEWETDADDAVRRGRRSRTKYGRNSCSCARWQCLFDACRKFSVVLNIEKFDMFYFAKVFTSLMLLKFGVNNDDIECFNGTFECFLVMVTVLVGEVTYFLGS